jgi:hypothetical protein
MSDVSRAGSEVPPKAQSSQSRKVKVNCTNVRAVLDADPGALGFPDQAALFADGDLPGDFHAAADTAENDYLPRF